MEPNPILLLLFSLQKVISQRLGLRFILNRRESAAPLLARLLRAQPVLGLAIRLEGYLKLPLADELVFGLTGELSPLVRLAVEDNRAVGVSLGPGAAWFVCVPVGVGDIGFVAPGPVASLVGLG